VLPVDELVQIEGMDGVRRALRLMGASGKKHSRKMVRGVADAVAAEAKTLAPVDTGLLRRSIVARSERDVAGGAVASVKVKPDAYYWRFLEYGDGPDGVEHAFFMRARKKVFADLDRVVVASFMKAVAGDMRRAAGG
jgi:HK97 gp10 family phage protein